MAEQWWAIYRQDTGELISVGSTDDSLTDEENARRVITDARAAEKGYIRLALAARPTEAQVWDPATRTFVPRVFKDLVRNFFDDPAIAALPLATRTILRAKIAEHLGLRERA